MSKKHCYHFKLLYGLFVVAIVTGFFSVLGDVSTIALTMCSSEQVWPSRDFKHLLCSRTTGTSPGEGGGGEAVQEVLYRLVPLLVDPGHPLRDDPVAADPGDGARHDPGQGHGAHPASRAEPQHSGSSHCSKPP